MKQALQTKAEIENFAVKLTDDCESHESWLALVRYGLGTLMGNQPLFFEIIWREAEKQLERKGVASHRISDEARFIFEELELKLTTINAC